MDYTALYNFRQTRPDLNDQDFLTWVNTPTLHTHLVAIADLQYYYCDNNNITTNLLAAQMSDNPQVKMLANVVLNLPSSRYTYVDLVLPSVASIISGLLASGLVTQDQVNAISALGNEVMARNCTPLGYNEVTQDMMTNMNKTPAIQTLKEQAQIARDAQINDANQTYQTTIANLQTIWDNPNQQPPAYTSA